MAIWLSSSSSKQDFVAPLIEALDHRVMLAVTATYSFADRALRVAGDALDNNIVISRDTGFGLLVNGGTVPIQGGAATITNTTQIFLLGADGNDNISIDETNGPIPGEADVFGGDGNGTIISGSGIDFISGDGGNDTVFMGDSADTFIWDPGDGNDVVDGEFGADELIFNGNDQAERFDVSDVGAGAPIHDVRFTRDLENVSLDASDIEFAQINTFSGADTVTANDQADTDLTLLNVDLRNDAEVGDGQNDSIIINGTDANDFGRVTSFEGAGGTRLQAFVGSSPGLSILGAEPMNDRLTLNGQGGNDTLEVNLSTAALVSADGGAGTDAINVVSTAPTGLVTVLPSSGDDTVNVNADGAGVANVAFDASQRVGALNIGNGGFANLTPGGAKVLTATSVNLTGSGTLDLNDNDLILDYSGASPLAGVANQIRTGRNGGAWTGAGLTSSVARNASPRNTTLGAMESTDFKRINGPAATFDGEPIDDTTVLVKYTYYGDTDFNGKVNFDDYVRTDSGFNNRRSGWSNGDFDGTGIVNFDDYVLIDLAFNTQSAAL